MNATTSSNPNLRCPRPGLAPPKRWPDAVRIDANAQRSIEGVARLVRHAGVMALQGKDQLDIASRGEAPFTDKLEHHHGHHMKGMAVDLLKGAFDAFAPMLALGIHSATSASAYSAMAQWLGANALLRSLDGTTVTPKRSLQAAIDSHARAYLAADVRDPKTIDAILPDYAENAVTVTTTLDGVTEPNPDGSKYTVIAQGRDQIREKFVKEVGMVKPRESNPQVDALYFEGELAILEWHSNNGVKGRDVFALDAEGKIWFQASLLQR